MSVQITDSRRFAFFIIDNEVLDSYEISAYGLLAYMAICRCSTNNQCSFSVRYLCEKARMSRPTFFKAVEELKSLELVRVESGDGEKNTYTLLPVKKAFKNPLIDQSTSLTPPSTTLTTPSLTLTPPVNVVNTKKTYSKKTSSPEEPTLHHQVAKRVQQRYQEHNKITCPWDASEAKILSNLINSNPSWKPEDYFRMIDNRFLSDGVNGERPRTWLANLCRWTVAPLDQYGKPKSKPIAEQVNLTGGLEQVMANRRANGFH